MHEQDQTSQIGDFPAQTLLVHGSEAFCVAEGVNLGDGLSVLEELVPDDIYELAPAAALTRLTVRQHGDGRLEIAQGTETGTPGAALFLDAALVLMSPDGQTTDAIVLVETDAAQDIAAIYLLPLAPITERTAYRLVKAEREAARRRFAQVACVSFTRGTHITLASGAQVPIEDLKVGDRVLTRDDGAQAIRWIGQSTVRASGDFAPVVITAGTLNNMGDLVVSPDHRLFVYQRSDELGAGKAELLVKARHLVNGDTVFAQRGGFVDYFQLVFDRHHIIYAEGIAAESLLIDPRTRPALPEELLERLSDLVQGHGPREAHGLDVQKALLDRPDAVDLLRRASMR